MALAPGTRLGAYEILSPIGAGGMGEVYRARDTRLKRDVAVKILPDAFASNPDRLARFQREAELLATLNHPNIAQIYGTEDRALVLELVEGPTLADRIVSGPLPFDEALPIARQIAEALEAAHERGVIHRDLKPANIKLRPDGTVKVLDFGLAKASEGPGSQLSPADFSQSPTITSPALMTMGGVILGTAAYMSPEQAKGREVDKRSDVWAFGCVLYEMLTGKRAFDGEDVSDTLAVILRGEPDWSALPADVHASVGLLVRSCLEKDRKKRIGDMAAARFVLDTSELTAPRSSAHLPHHSRGMLPQLAAGFLTAVLIGAVWAHFARETPLVPESLALSIALPEGASVGHLELSPDGRKLALTPYGLKEQARSQLWVRSMDSQQFQPLTGTVGARTPFWSPDSRSIGFFADGKLKVVPASGGPVQELCDETGLGSGGTWNRDGVILIGGSGIGAGPLRRANAAGGGACPELTKPEATRGHMYPVFLPDGNHYFYLESGDPATQGIYLASLQNPVGQRLLPDFSNVLFSPSIVDSSHGHLLFLREGALMAQPFDLRTLQPRGDVFSVIENASQSISPPQAAATIGGNGVLVYLANKNDSSQLRWLDRAGREITRIGAESLQRQVSLSPNERMVAFMRGSTGWLRDLSRDIETPFPGSWRRAGGGAWSPDARQFVSGRPDGRLVITDIDSARERDLRVASGRLKNASDWSRDGRFLFFTEINPKTQGDIWALPDPLKENGGPAPFAFAATPAMESQAQISPDGEWVAYTSDESGDVAVYVARFPKGSSKMRISSAQGGEPRWSRDGRELYYLTRSGDRANLMVVSIDPGSSQSELSVGKAIRLFEFPGAGFVAANNIFLYSPSSDSKRFLVNVLTSDQEPTLNVITSWQARRREAATSP